MQPTLKPDLTRVVSLQAVMETPCDLCGDPASLQLGIMVPEGAPAQFSIVCNHCLHTERKKGNFRFVRQAGMVDPKQ